MRKPKKNSNKLAENAKKAGMTQALLRAIKDGTVQPTQDELFRLKSGKTRDR